jgi:hypothetical protein
MSLTTAAPIGLPARKTGLLRTDFLFGYGLVIGFVLATGGLVLVHAGSFLQFAYPMGATSLAVFLYRWRRSVYVAYVWWIWLFTPEVRRLVDFQTRYHSVSPIMITPLLVTLLTMAYLLAKPKAVLRRKMLPFSVFGLVLIYGLIVGVIVSGPFAAIYDFANWFSPLCFGTYLLLDSANFKTNRTALISANMTGLLATAGYGLYQFYRFPPWDAFWVNNANLHSLGQGVAEAVRLFGPLNSPLPYGIALMIPLTFAWVTRGPVRILGAFIGFPAFGLSLVRFAWIGWVVAVGYLLARMGGKIRIRIVVSAIIVAVLAYPLVTVGPAADALSKRFSTFGNIQQDGSVQARTSEYRENLIAAFSQPLGLGLGSNSVAAGKIAASTQTGFDSGILLIPLIFGWTGAILILWVLASLGFRTLAIARSKTDNIGLAAAGVYLAMLLQPIGEVSFAGFLGLATWCFAAIAYRGKP